MTNEIIGQVAVCLHVVGTQLGLVIIFFAHALGNKNSSHTATSIFIDQVFLSLDKLTSTGKTSRVKI